MLETIVYPFLIDYFPIIMQVVIRAVVLMIMGLGAVYIVGRMLEIVTTARTKNIVALLVMTLLSYWSVLIYDNDILIHEWEMYWRSGLYVMLASILYVLVGFDLYVRFNSFCDRKFGKPDEAPKPKTKSKPKT